VELVPVADGCAAELEAELARVDDCATGLEAEPAGVDDCTTGLEAEPAVVDDCGTEPEAESALVGVSETGTGDTTTVVEGSTVTVVLIVEVVKVVEPES